MYIILISREQTKLYSFVLKLLVVFSRFRDEQINIVYVKKPFQIL
jgi:hypothetical protein